MLTALSIAGIGLGFGIIHVLTGPDHLSALATLSANVGNCRAFSLGVKWGIGHSIGLVIVATALLLASMGGGEDEEIDVPEAVSNVLESFVGVFMILLGLYGVRNAYKKRRDGTETDGLERLNHINHHFHNGVEPYSTDFSMMDNGKEGEMKHDPSSTQVVDDGGGDDHNCSMRTIITVCIGIVHGVAGPGGVLGVIPAVQLHDWGLASLYLGCFCASSTLTMGCYAAGYGVCSSKIGESGGLGAGGVGISAFRVELFSAFLSIFVGVMWLVLLSLGILDDVFP